MKRILLILFLTYNSLFAVLGTDYPVFSSPYWKSYSTTNSYSLASCESKISSVRALPNKNNWSSTYHEGNINYYSTMTCYNDNGYYKAHYLYVTYIAGNSSNSSTPPPLDTDDGLCQVNIDGSLTCIIVPENSSGFDGNGKPICNSGYSNNVINDENVCILTPDNSNGFTPDGEPDCKSDYVLEEGICIPKPNCSALISACASSCIFGVKNHLCTNGVEVTPCECNTPPPPKTNDDGSVTETNSENGNTTTTYPDGSTQTNDINGNPISSTPATNGTGGTGTNGGSGGTNGIGGEEGTGTEAGTGSGDENDLTPPSVASSCSDTNMTLEQKMLCELNEGMKNQNSEGSPENSLNNLIKDLVANNSKDNKAINDNIKDLKTNSTITNSRLTAVNSNLSALKTINQQIVSNGNKTNEELEKINNVTTPSDTDIKLDDSDSTLDSLVNEFNEFSTTLSSSVNSIKTMSIEAQNTIDGGFSLENLKGLGEVTTCPHTFELHFNGSTQYVQTDVCVVTSKFYFVFYPISFMFLLFGVIKISISVLRSV